MNRLVKCCLLNARVDQAVFERMGSREYQNCFPKSKGMNTHKWIVAIGLRPWRAWHTTGSAGDVPCRRGCLIANVSTCHHKVQRSMNSQNLRSAGEDANFSPEMALARTNPNRSMLNHIAFPLRPRPRLQAAERRAMPVTTQYPAVRPIVAQNKMFQSPYRPPVSVGRSLVVYASKHASSWAGLEESTIRMRVTIVPRTYWPPSGIETPIAKGPAGRGQYVVTLSGNAGNGEGGRIASQRLVDVSWTLKLRNVVLVKRVAVEKGQQKSPPVHA
jgi:hypothetical protein